MIRSIIKYICVMPFIFISKGVKTRDMVRVSRQATLFRVDNRKISLGKNCHIGNFSSPGFFFYSYIEVRPKSTGVNIGDNTKIGNGFSLISNKGIEIGSNCLIGNQVKIFDSDFHSLGIDRSHCKASSKNIAIADNVFIGDNVIILKGVSIGVNSVIGAGSVVTQSVGANEVYAGNPAKKIKDINEI